jgi:hypothetical protein
LKLGSLKQQINQPAEATAPLPHLILSQEGKMFISKFYMPLTDDSDKTLVKIAKFALIVAANVVLDRLGGPRLPNNTRF